MSLGSFALLSTFGIVGRPATTACPLQEKRQAKFDAANPPSYRRVDELVGYTIDFEQRSKRFFPNRATTRIDLPPTT